jgi:hypothetical protein
MTGVDGAQLATYNCRTSILGKAAPWHRTYTGRKGAPMASDEVIVGASQSESLENPSKPPHEE